MAQPTVEEQLTNALQQLAELESLKEKMVQSEAEILQLKESESALKQKLEKTKGSGSKIQPGTPFSSIIKHFDFSSFGSPSTKKKVINIDDEDTPKDDGEKPDETGAAIMMAVVQEIKKLHDKIEKIPGVPAAMEEVAPDSYADSPFEEKIASVDLPKKFVVPTMRTYDGTTDPLNHVAFYKQKMLAASIPSDFREVCMCKGFGTTLTGPALQWFINLPNGSIKSFADLINTFNQQFASSRELEKRSSDLYRVTQRPDESLRSYLNRFNKEKVSIPRCDEGTAVEAFRRGVLHHADLYDELTMHPCHTFQDVQAKTIGYIRLEEDKNYKVGDSSNAKADKTNRKAATYSRGNYRAAPYTKPDRSEVNMTYEQPGKAKVHPPISEYNFCVDVAGLIQRLDNMGQVVRWPRKVDHPNPRKDQSKWCEFHMDAGHTTDDCFTLRKEVAYLLKAGYLKDLIRTKGTRAGDTRNNQEQQEHNLPPPPPLYEVKFITGGSEICGLTSSAAKKVARTSKIKSPCKPGNIPSITFSDCDLVGIPDLHHDGLVISMQIGTATVRRILVDGGSSVNLIMLDVLKAMKISEDQITKKSSVLVGFSGETKSTLGEIYLPTYAEGVTSYERFGVLDCLSSYNAILGRPWIHNVKAVPSTYHQCIKVPTDWGVATIKGEHKAAQECYTEALKPSKAGKSLA